MGAINENHIPYPAGKLYIASYATGIPTYTIGTNDNTVASYIDANFSFTRLATVRGLQIGRNLGDTVVDIKGDECDIGTAMSFTRPAITITCDWVESLNPEALEILTGKSVLDVAGTLVSGATQTVVNPSSYDDFQLIENQNGDGSAVVVASVAGSVDTSLTVNVDYRVVQNGEGKYGIILISGTNITTLTQTFTITYSYTPNVAKYSGLKVESIVRPRLIAKIIGCDDNNSKNNTHYLVDCKINSEIISSFVDVIEGGDVTPTPIELITNIGGYVVDKFERI